MKKIITRAQAYLASEKGKLAVSNARNAMPMLVVMAVLMAAGSANAETTTSIGTKISGGFMAIFNTGKLVVGGIATAMALFWGFKWITGDQEAMKKAIGTGIAGLVVYNLDVIIKLFMDLK